MRASIDSPRCNAVLLTCVLIPLACADPARIASPHGVAEPNALSDKQSTTGRRILFVRGFPSKVLSINQDGTEVIPASPPGAWYDADADGPLTENGCCSHTRTSSPSSRSPFRHECRRYRRHEAHRSIDRHERLRSSGAREEHRLCPLGPCLHRALDDGCGRFESTQLTTGPFDTSPAPSPGGKLVAFSRNNDVYALNVETRAPTNLTNSPAAERTPSCRPSESRSRSRCRTSASRTPTSSS